MHGEGSDASEALERRAKAFSDGPNNSSVITDIDDEPAVGGDARNQGGDGKSSSGEASAGEESGGGDEDEDEDKEQPPKPLDLDLVGEAQEEIVKRASSFFERDLSDFVRRFQSAMQDRSDKGLAAERTRHLDEKIKLENKIEALKEENFKLNQDSLQAQKFRSGIAEKWWSMNKRNGKNIQKNHFKEWLAAWRQKISDEGRLKWVQGMMKTSISSRILHAWLKKTLDKKHEKTVKFWENKMRQALAAYIMRYEAELTKAREDLATERARLREQKKTKSSMEQKMKQAFLRSVKSLNMEAFQLVNELPSDSTD